MDPTVEMIWEAPAGFEDVPKEVTDEFVAQLRQHPRQWAKWPDDRPFAWADQMLVSYPGLEAQVRDCHGFTWTHYFRWVGTHLADIDQGNL